MARDRRLAFVGDEALVDDERRIEAGAAAPDQPQDVLRPRPSTRRLRLPVERKRTAHLPAGNGVVGRHQARQRGSELVVEPLVGVDAEDPWLRRLHRGRTASAGRSRATAG